MNNSETKLKIVRLMEPLLCLTCRFATIATVELESGEERRTLHCTRLDCDNWQEDEDKETPVAMRLD